MEGGRSRQVGVLTAVAKNARSRSESEWRDRGGAQEWDAQAWRAQAGGGLERTGPEQLQMEASESPN